MNCALKLMRGLKTDRRVPLPGHDAAKRDPRGFELPILGMARCLADYADEHHERYGSDIGEDVFLGREWETMARALLGLLNGETGRLDCGLVDKAIRAMGVAAGVNLDD